MLIKRKKEEMGTNKLDWLDSLFHFSFDHYYDKKHVNYGVLRVLNDDLIKPNTGFPMHPHRDMEIISYVVDGELTHGDSMGHSSTIGRGEIQYMSAGAGVYHTESNDGDVTTHLLQLWITPTKKDLKPNYGDYRFPFKERVNSWLHMVSGKDGNAAIKINQDANIYSSYLGEGKQITFDLKDNRQAYLVQIEGESIVNGEVLEEKNACMIQDEAIDIHASKTSHFLLVEMSQSKE